MSMVDEAPTAIHIGDEALPWFDVGGGVELKLVQAKVSEGIWVIRNRFQPGAAVQIHKHTGQVHAFTLSGSWHYLESADQVSRAGSYLFEPAGSIHTLVVPESNTEVTDVWFTIHGANLNLDADGNIESVIDAGGMLAFYLALCEEAGITDPPVVRD